MLSINSSCHYLLQIHRCVQYRRLGVGNGALTCACRPLPVPHQGVGKWTISLPSAMNCTLVTRRIDVSVKAQQQCRGRMDRWRAFDGVRTRRSRARDRSGLRQRDIRLSPEEKQKEGDRSNSARRIFQVVSDKVYYMKQTVGNACGTVALLHAAGNALGTVSYGKHVFKAELGRRRVCGPSQHFFWMCRGGELPC